MARSLEQIKMLRNPLDVWGAIERATTHGFDSISPDDLQLFRWYGLYTQQPEDAGYFMLRVRIPGGRLQAAQLRVIGEIASKWGRNTADFTTRQGIQMHWLQIEQIPTIIHQLRDAGLSTTDACGDCPRNITQSPVAGHSIDELFDTTDLVRQMNLAMEGHPDLQNLPRKFKIAICGHPSGDAFPQINDVGLQAIRLDNGSIAFDLRVGGGLSSKPHFAQRLRVAVRPSQVVEAVLQICFVFRDHGNRQRRQRARMKFLVAEWGPERFLGELERRLGYDLEPLANGPQLSLSTCMDHMGVHPSKEQGQYYVGVPIPAGRVSGTQLLGLADAAERFGSGLLSGTFQQNAIIFGVQQAHLAPLKQRLAEIDLPVNPGSHGCRFVCCTGKEFCKHGLAETKASGRRVIEQLDSDLGPAAAIRINMNGCPNSCGHHLTSDIGLTGALIKRDGQTFDAFDVLLGNGENGTDSFARPCGLRIPVNELASVIADIIQLYDEQRRLNQTFRQFVSKVGADKIAAIFPQHSRK